MDRRRAGNHRLTRVGRLVGACAVIGALLAGPLAVAGSAATPLSSFAGQGTGYALRVVVDLSGLPQAAKDLISKPGGPYATLAAASGGKLPAQFPFVIDQRFIQTLSDMGKTMHAHSMLVSGLLGSAANSADATKIGQSDSASNPSAPLPGPALPLITAATGKLNAAITSVPRVTSDGSLASVQASLASLLTASIFPAEIQAVFAKVKSEIDAKIVTANGSLDTALGQIAASYSTVAATTDPILGPVLGQAALKPILTSASALQNAVNVAKIPSVDDLLGTVAASVKGLSNTAAAEQSGGKAFSDAHSKISSIDLLGLLHVGLVDLTSHSEAAGTPGSAHNTSSCSLSTARLGPAGVSLDGKSIVVSGVPVPVPAANLLAVKNAVDMVTTAAGLAVGLCDAASPVAAKDGTSASQTVSALRITFAPTLKVLPEGNNTLSFLTGSTPLKITIDPSVQTAASAKVAAVGAAPALPRTGPGSMPIIVGLIVAAGAAIYLLRNRLSSLIRTPRS